MYIFDMRYESFERYLSSCEIRDVYPKIREIIHIFTTRRLEIPFFDFNVNTKCTLKCKKCDQGIPYMKRREEYSFEQLKKHIDELLEKVDYIYQISILGGEPFLNQDLNEILTYCCECKKIGSIILVTNGTIYPEEKVLKALKNNKIRVGISWYPLKNTYNRTRLIQYLEGNNIKYNVRRANWLDFGDWNINRNYSEDRIKRNYKNCFLKNCVQYNNGVLYRCAKVVLLEDQQIINPNNDEYIIVNSNNSKRDFKNSINRFYSTKYIQSCNYCNSGEDLVEIPLGEQL